MTANLHLDFVVLYVSDLDASRRYFTETLGFVGDPGQSGETFHFLRSQGAGIDFGLQLASAETPRAGTSHLYFYFDSRQALEEQRAALLAKGVEASPTQEMPFGTIFNITSPDGQPLTMMVPPAENA